MVSKVKRSLERCAHYSTPLPPVMPCTCRGIGSVSPLRVCCLRHALLGGVISSGFHAPFDRQGDFEKGE